MPIVLSGRPGGTGGGGPPSGPAGGDLAGTYPDPTLAPGLVPTDLAYVEKTTNTAITATTEATAQTIVTAGAVVLDGSTLIEIRFFCPAVETDGNHDVRVALYDGAGSIGIWGNLYGGGSGDSPFLLSRLLTPSAASHTYSARGYVGSGNGTAYAGAGGAGNYVPAYIRVMTVV